MTVLEDVLWDNCDGMYGLKGVKVMILKKSCESHVFPVFYSPFFFVLLLSIFYFFHECRKIQTEAEESKSDARTMRVYFQRIPSSLEETKRRLSKRSEPEARVESELADSKVEQMQGPKDAIGA